MADAAVLEVRRAVRAPLRAVAAAAPDSTVLVALSGGADSLALLAATVAEGRGLGLRTGSVTIDHALQRDATAVAADAAAIATTLGAEPAEVVRVEVDGGGGPEAAARDARYAALCSAARRHGAQAVLLGHTRDDQAESVLLGLARGSGARSLSGMSPARELDGVTYLRPLLGVARATTRAACDQLGLAVWDDPHNLEAAYARSRVRHELLPEVTRVLGPGAVDALARSASLLRDDADALDTWAAEGLAAVRGSDGSLDATLLRTYPTAVRTRILKRAAIESGARPGSLTASHVQQLDALVDRWHGQGEIALPGPVAAERSCGRLTFRGR